MFSPSALLALAAFGAALWFWQDSLRAREQVLAACTRACRSADVQLLDETVALDRLRLVRDRGRLILARQYNFEFTQDGSERWHGRAHLVGRRLERLQLNRPDGVTVLQES